MLKLFTSNVILRVLFMGSTPVLLAIQRTWTIWRGHSSRLGDLCVYFPSPFTGIADFPVHRNCLLILEVWAKVQNSVSLCHYCHDQINFGQWTWYKDECGLQLTQKFDLLPVGLLQTSKIAIKANWDEKLKFSLNELMQNIILPNTELLFSVFSCFNFSTLL